MKQSVQSSRGQRNMQLSDPPTEPLQLFLLNINAAATLSAACPEIATASRTGCRDATEPLAKSFYDCPFPFRRVALSHAHLPPFSQTGHRHPQFADWFAVQCSAGSRNCLHRRYAFSCHAVVLLCMLHATAPAPPYLLLPALLYMAFVATPRLPGGILFAGPC